MPSTTESAAVAVASPRPVTLVWALKRAVLGIVIIAVSMGGVAWLTYASIDPDTEPAATKAAKAPRATKHL